MDAEEKRRESRLRLKAERRGLLLVKSRRRDPDAIGYGLYVLVPDIPANRKPRHGGQTAIRALESGKGLSLDEVDRQLRG